MCLVPTEQNTLRSIGEYMAIEEGAGSQIGIMSRHLICTQILYQLC